MKLLIYGVTNWEDKSEFESSCIKCNKGYNLIQWYNRIVTFIPAAKKIFITTGTWSDPSLVPIPVEVVQIPFIKTIPYTNQNSYFRVGLMTGIWKALLNYPDFDILLHCQTSRLLGQNILPLLEEFMKSKEQLMAMRFTSGKNRESGTNGIDVGFMAMKRNAALMYAVAGRRQSCENNPEPMTCEEEAYLLFKDSWKVMWPEIPTPKQRDLTYEGLTYNPPKDSWYEITDIEYFKKLPIIANGKHITHEFYEAWLEANPYEKEEQKV